MQRNNWKSNCYCEFLFVTVVKTIIMDIYFASDNAILRMIGEKVQQRRTSARLTQKQVAERANVALSAISNIENGKNVALATLISILRTLDALTLIEPFYREEPISPNAIARYAKKNPRVKRVRKMNTDQKPESEW